MTTMTVTPDDELRQYALRPELSFIVQAPAGSGKTELLTQRILVLLANLPQAPEELVAITFTRKAASEIRTRIIEALQKAATLPPPEAKHARKTWELARAVLAKDHQENWQLLDNPNRLRIQTIDSFCASLTRQMPVLSQLGANPNLVDDANTLYQAAAQKVLAGLEDSDASWAKALASLLLHLDNDQAKLEQLLVDMLARRDQWLPYLPHHHAPIKKDFDLALQNITVENLKKLQLAIPTELVAELLILTRFAAQQLLAIDSQNPLTLWQELTELPATTLADYEVWLGLATFLLTNSFQWRKNLTKNEGFPAANSSKDKQEKRWFQEMKQRMQSLLAACANYPEFRQALQDVLESPPSAYSEGQWQIINSLLQVLPILAAHLKVEFQLHNKVDYIEIANSALAALGDPQEPTDLALALDYRIQHILVDEFQDTSVNQFRLLELLTAGWQPGDGRTLFLVGDPMQSIYRFRKAEVGLFLRARYYGVGQVSLEAIHLTSNFRSAPEIIDWINQTFQATLPVVEDIAAGAVTYTPTLATRPPLQRTAVFTYPAYQADFVAEAQTVVDIIQRTLANDPSGSIAILVRAKSHLTAIIPALQRANIPYHATDIDPLMQRSVIQDLLALTRALLHPGDRIAWLALLRAPWCGLELADLHLIAAKSPLTTIWDCLQQVDNLPLSPSGRQRVARISTVLNHSLQQRQRLPLSTWIRGTWLALKGPACLQYAADLQDANQFFNLLHQVEQAGDIPDLAILKAALTRLYATPTSHADTRVEIMSIHKSKGLEFNTVILPGLGRSTSNDKSPLMMWLERPRAHAGMDLILAPIKASEQDTDKLSSYLRREEAKRAQYETARLLYVAATRAKQSLHLLGHCSVKSQANENISLAAPANNTLLAHLWQQLAIDYQKAWFSQQMPSTSSSLVATLDQPLKRLIGED